MTIESLTDGTGKVTHMRLIGMLACIVGGCLICLGVFYFVYPLLDKQVGSTIFDDYMAFNMTVIWITTSAFLCSMGGFIIKIGIDVWRYKDNRDHRRG